MTDKEKEDLIKLADQQIKDNEALLLVSAKIFQVSVEALVQSGFFRGEAVEIVSRQGPLMKITI